MYINFVAHAKPYIQKFKNLHSSDLWDKNWQSFPITEPAKNGFFKTIRPDGSSAGEGISIYICGTT